MPGGERRPSGRGEMPEDWPSDADPQDPSFDIRREWPADVQAPGTEKPGNQNGEGENPKS